MSDPTNELTDDSKRPATARPGNDPAPHWYILAVQEPDRPGLMPGDVAMITAEDIDRVASTLPSGTVIDRIRFERQLGDAVIRAGWGRKMDQRWVTSSRANDDLVAIASAAQTLYDALATAPTSVRNVLQQAPTWPKVLVHERWAQSELAMFAFMHQLERLRAMAMSKRVRNLVSEYENFKGERPKRRVEDVVKDTFVDAMFDLYSQSTGSPSEGKYFKNFVAAALHVAGLHKGDADDGVADVLGVEKLITRVRSQRRRGTSR